MLRRDPVSVFTVNFQPEFIEVGKFLSRQLEFTDNASLEQLITKVED